MAKQSTKKRKLRKSRQAAQAANAKRRKSRRRGNQTLSYLLMAFVVLAVCVTLSLTVLFKIEYVRVEGNTKYANDLLVQSSGIQMGDNLFRVSENGIEKALIAKYPYIDDVSIKREFPPTIILDITQAVPYSAISSGSEYVLIDKNGKVLEMNVVEAPKDVMTVTGMALDTPVEGKLLGEGSQEGMRMLNYLGAAIETTGFTDINYVDFSDRLNIKMIYQNRIRIELGSEGELEYKLRFVKEIIDNQQPADFMGVIDASIAKEVWTRPENIFLETGPEETLVIEQGGAQSVGERENSEVDIPSDGAVTEPDSAPEEQKNEPELPDKKTTSGYTIDIS